MRFVDAAKNFDLALLRIDLQQIYFGEAVLADDVGHRGQRTIDGFRAETIGGQRIDVGTEHVTGIGQLVLHDVADHGLDCGTILAFVRMETREDGGMFVKGELRLTLLFGDAAIESVNAAGLPVRRAVCLQEIKGTGRRLECVDGRVPTPLMTKSEKSPMFAPISMTVSPSASWIS